MSTMTQAELLRESLRLLVRRLGVLERSEASCCEITMSQCHALVEIGRAGRLSVNVLAEVLGLDKSTVSRSIDKLVGDGLVIRDTDPEDRRYVVLRLSDKGEAVFREIEKRMVTYFEEVIAAIPPEKRGQIIDSIQFLIKAVKGPGFC